MEDKNLIKTIQLLKKRNLTEEQHNELEELLNNKTEEAKALNFFFNMYNEFQKLGIGTKLVSFLLEELSHIDVVSLFSEDDLIPFYEKNNFRYSKSQFVMHKK